MCSSCCRLNFPGVLLRTGWAMYPETLKKAIDELIARKC